MSDDFTARLQTQLRDAAWREERRGALSRTLLAARPRPAVALGALAAAVAAALLVLFSIGLGAREPEPATPPGPRVVANVEVAGQLTPNVGTTAFGSAWLNDSSRGEIIRVDRRTRRVTARIPVGGDASIAAAAGSVWALPRPSDALVRIDPRSNRVAARIPLGNTFANSTVVPAGSRVWAIGQNGAAAVDTARGRVVARIGYSASGFQLVDAFVRGDELWMTSADGTVRRYDARTGRRLGRLPWKPEGTLYPLGDALIAVPRPGAAVALVDPRTGRAHWRSSVRGEIHEAEVAGTRVYLAGTDPGGRERFWVLDGRNGRSLGTLAVPGFSVVGVVPIGRDVWLPLLGGRVVIVAP
jgi:putative pyrroloquinoline-quinone binding quinoprotein